MPSPRGWGRRTDRESGSLPARSSRGRVVGVTMFGRPHTEIRIAMMRALKRGFSAGFSRHCFTHPNHIEAIMRQRNNLLLSALLERAVPRSLTFSRWTE